jgi:hypothetical protein
MQRDLMALLPKSPVGLSVRDTIYQCIMAGEVGIEAANRLKKELKVSDRV